MNGPENTPVYRQRWFGIALGGLISAVCLWLAVRPLIKEPGAWDQMKMAFRQANYGTLPIILVILFIFYWLKAWRWRLMLLPVGSFQPMRDLFNPIMIGFAFNNVLPARLGEFVRCLVFARQQRVPLVASLSSVALERVFDGIAIVTYLTVGLFLVEGLDPQIQRSAVVIAVIACASVAAGLVFVIWTKPFIAAMEAVFRLLPFIPRSLVEKISGLLASSAQGLASLKNVRLLLLILAISYLKWGLNGALFLVSLRAFQIDVSPQVAMVLMGVVAFAVAVPNAPGYFGVIQLCFMKVLGLFGFNQEQVFAASIYYHLAQYIPVTLYGLLAFSRTGMSVRDVEQAGERLETVPPAAPPQIPEL